jgi:hypothetical protein
VLSRISVAALAAALVFYIEAVSTIIGNYVR